MTGSATLNLVIARMPSSMFKSFKSIDLTMALVTDHEGNQAHVEVVEELDRSGFSARATGNFRIKVQPANVFSPSAHVSYIRWNASSDPVKLDEFWVSKATAACRKFADLNKKKAATADRELKTRTDLTTVMKEIGLEGDYAVCVSSGYKQGDHWINALNVRLTHLTPEQAVAILKAAQAAGVKLH